MRRPLVTAAAVPIIVLTACSASPTDQSTRAGAGSSTSASPTAPGDLCFEQGEPFEGEARVYIEHNSTDEDTGFHGMFDQEGLAEGCLQTPDGEQILLVDPVGQLGDLGINQFFFESREPPNDEYSIADLEADFPEGDYRISGVDYQGVRRAGTAVFTHDIPAPPTIVAPKLVGEDQAEGNVLPTTGLTVDWDPVTETIDGTPVEVVGYQLIVTQDVYEPPHAGDNLSRPEYNAHVPADVTELTVADGFLLPGTLYEVEVLALEKTGNQTITVGFFTTG